MHIKRRVLAALVTITAAISIGAWSVAQAAQQPLTTAKATADDQPSVVEDYTYPDAAGVLATYKVTVISGDGHILVVDCATPPEGNFGLLVVRSNESAGAGGTGKVCFKITSTSGFLNLKLPGVYELKGDGRTTGTGHKVKADLTTDNGQRTIVDVDPSGSTQVGTGTGTAPTTLLRLDVAP
ncbi:hypothetical protein [Amycolatopsis sp. NPDC059657]|uniref:hypothetical protein n=1 Tax=Amycolatopsis sp. NPDC059657 TaxID=3346899 RepID=UPI00366ECA55